MHLIIKTLLASLLIGLSFGIYLYIVYDPHWQRIATSLISAITIGALMMACIYQRRYILWISPHQSLKVLMMIVLLCAAALIGTEFTLFSQELLKPDGRYVLFNGGNIYVLNLLIVFVTGIPMYVSEETKESLNTRLMTQQYRLLQLEKQQAEAELELLRAKVNPHFLYNVHNTIVGLIHTNPNKAEKMTLLLSSFFRFTLNKASTGFHTVKDELDIVRTYLQLQQIRYENRLNYNIHAEPILMSYLVPSFLLQPLVENAVKHGIEKSAGQGSISLEFYAEDQKLILIVVDSGPDFPDAPSTGHGISIIINKLNLLYQHNYSLELINKPYKHVCITLPQVN